MDASCAPLTPPLGGAQGPVGRVFSRNKERAKRLRPRTARLERGIAAHRNANDGEHSQRGDYAAHRLERLDLSSGALAFQKVKSSFSPHLGLELWDVFLAKARTSKTQLKYSKINLPAMNPNRARAARERERERKRESEHKTTTFVEYVPRVRAREMCRFFELLLDHSLEDLRKLVAPTAPRCVSAFGVRCAISSAL